MNKQDYLAATNLVRARIAYSAIADIELTEEDGIKNKYAVLSALDGLVGGLEERVRKSLQENIDSSAKHKTIS